MTIYDVILIIMLGYSPSGASGVEMVVKEYPHQSLETCNAEAKKINDMYDRRFDKHAFCVIRKKK